MPESEYSPADNLSKFFQGDRNILILAADHRYLGMEGLDNPTKDLPELLPYADALMTDISTLKALRNHADHNPKFKKTLDKTPIFLRCSASPGLALGEVKDKKPIPSAMPHEFLSFRAQDLIYHEVQAAAVSVYLREPSGLELEKRGYEAALQSRLKTLENLSTMYKETSRLGKSLLGVVAVGEELESINMQDEVDWFLRAIRVITSVGVNAIKTYYCGEETKRIVQAALVPVVIAGGKAPKDRDPTKDSLEFAIRVMESNAKGLDVGRRVWRHHEKKYKERDPKEKASIAMLRTYQDIVHKGLSSLDSAIEKYYSYLEEENR